MRKIERAFFKAIREDALRDQKGRCMYCKSPLSLNRATADHLKPQCRGGGNHRENIVAACSSCNRTKGKLSEGQFFKLIKRDFPKGQRPEVIAIWATRRIWKRTYLAQKRIEQFVGASQ